MERQRKAQARHLALLSSDAPVMNRCAKEEAHLKQRLAQSTAALTRSARQNQAAADREERSRDTQLHAQLTAILGSTPDIIVPARVGSEAARAADAAPAGLVSSGRAVHSRAAAEPSRIAASAAPPHDAAGPSPSSAYLLGFPEPFETSGFKSAVHWASVAYDETYLTAYGPRRLREETQANTVAEAGGLCTARDARPHRLMAAVACYLLNEVLCADSNVSTLWQEKLRQPIFDAIFSSQTIEAGQEKRKAYQSLGKAGSDAARSQVIVQHTLGALPNALGEDEGALTGTGTVTSGAAAAPPSPPELPFPPRTNTYARRDDFASMRLWTEEVTAEQREKALVCRRVRTLQNLIERRMQLLHVYQKQSNDALVRTIFTMWRTHTRQTRTHNAAMERYLENRHARVVAENVFLRWRRVTLQTKVESLQRRMLNIVAEREEAAHQHAADLVVVQEQLTSERRRHQQNAYEQDALHTQILESHSMEVEALRLVLHQQRVQTAEVGRWAKRWERLAKTFRPAQLCPAIPPSMWSLTRALYDSEETVVATVLGRGADRRVLQQMPYSLILPIRERLERLLLAWVNAVMEKSPLASSWVTLETFMHGRSTRPRSILVAQKPDAEQLGRSRSSAAAAANGPDSSSYLTEFGVYTLMAFVRELRRLYTVAGKMADPELAETRLPRGTGFGGGGRTSLAKCFREVVQLLSVQTCSGLYPSLLMHCPSLARWFNPEGVFGGPTQSFEGAGKERRLQHTMFVWLLTTLLVGHIRLTILAPAGQKDDGLPSPSLSSVGLQCAREEELARIPQMNFPVEAPLPAPESDANSVSLGTTVVSQNTFLSKKAQGAAGGKATKNSVELAKGGSVAGTGDTAAVAAAAAANTMTLETALRERLLKTGATMINEEDSLSDIEAYLGLLTTQARALRNPESRAAKSAGASSHGAEGGTKNNSNNHHNGEGNDDDLVTGLLQQLVEARDAAAQSRRVRRLQRTEEKATNAEGSGNGESQGPFASFPDEERRGSDTYDPEDENAHTFSAHFAEGKASAVLTAGQLRILRSLPSRSSAFDSARRVPPVSKPASAARAPSDAPDPDGAAVHGGPSGQLYSFLLNTLEDVARRQQWAGLARIVTSLVVRFHILDDVEDGVQRATMVQSARDEAAREETQSRPASSRPQRTESVVSLAAPSTSSMAVSQSARLPTVTTTGSASATTARDGAAVKARKSSLAEKRGTTAVSSPRVAARLVPSRPPPASALPNSAEARLASTAPASARVNGASVGEDLLRATAPAPAPGPTAHSAEGHASAFTRDSPVATPNARSKNAGPLLGPHELRMLRGEMSARGQHGATAAVNAQRASASMSGASSTRRRKAERASNSAASTSPTAPKITPVSPPATQVISLAGSRLYIVDAAALPQDEPGHRGTSGSAGVAGTGHSSTGPDSTDLSIVSTTEDAGVGDLQEMATVSEADSALELHEVEQVAPSLQASPEAPYMSPPTNEIRRDTMRFSTGRGESEAPQTTSSAASTRTPTPPQSVEQRPLPHSTSQPTAAMPGVPDVVPPPPVVRTPAVSRQAMGEVVEDDTIESGDGVPHDQVGYLDPLIEHGSQQSSSAAQNIRKYRFNMQP